MIRFKSLRFPFEWVVALIWFAGIFVTDNAPTRLLFVAAFCLWAVGGLFKCLRNRRKVR